MSRDLEARLQTELDRLASTETLTAKDLDRFRQALPTDPQTAELVERALPFPWSEVFEYVEGSDRQSAYWRVKPDRSEPRSEADRVARERFAEAAREARGLEGTAERDGRTLPASAAHIADAVAREEPSDDGDSDGDGGHALRRLREVLDL